MPALWHYLGFTISMNIFLDHFLTIFHSIFVLFVLVGWIFPITRKAHLIALGLTLVAWLGIGLWVGTIGYCPLTDWHWDIKRELGERNMSGSFISYMLTKVTGIVFERKLVDIGTAAGLVISVLAAAYVNFRSYLETRKNVQTN